MTTQTRRVVIALGIWAILVILIGVGRLPNLSPAMSPPMMPTAVAALPAAAPLVAAPAQQPDAAPETASTTPAESASVEATAGVTETASTDAGATTVDVTANGSMTTTGAADSAPVVELPPVSSVADPLVAVGENVFQRTAGGVGCQLCHGVDARGLVGPNIVGKTEDAIRSQFETNAQMQFIILSDKEMTGVATYLQFLADPSAFALLPGGGSAAAADSGVAAAGPAPELSDPFIAQGEEIYQKSAGGVGCQLCHGKDAQGATAPHIVGKSADDIHAQFARSTVERFIILTDQEIDAVAGYLNYLANPGVGFAPVASASIPAEDALSLSNPTVAQGEEIYQISAGGVGCQICHGKDGKGFLGPDIVGKTVEDIRYQFANSTAEQSITLTDAEFDAVATYLQYLATQP